MTLDQKYVQVCNVQNERGKEPAVDKKEGQEEKDKRWTRWKNRGRPMWYKPNSNGFTSEVVVRILVARTRSMIGYTPCKKGRMDRRAIAVRQTEDAQHNNARHSSIAQSASSQGHG